jgi:PTS system nitrogen regulatory IIA component
MPLDLQETAAMLGVSPDTVSRWARQGRLGVLRPSGGFFVELTELQRWARNQGLRLRQPAETTSPPVDPVRRPLAAALARGAILHDVVGDSPDAVLAEVVLRAPLTEGVDRAALLAALLERESLATTALGGGVALPHPRTPSSDFVAEPTVVVAMLDGESDWAALDGAPVHSAVLLVSPTAQQHLQVLSRVAFLLRDGRFAELLRARASAEAVSEMVAELEPDAG